MNGPNHYREAQRDIDRADGANLSNGEAAYIIARAQVHATLALSAAIIDGLLDNLGAGQITGQPSEWARAVSS